MSLRTLTRKSFLRVVAALGILGVTALQTGCGSSGGGDGGGHEPPPVDGGRVRAFKLSSRGKKGCKACTNHARYKLFETAAAADANRAHGGCDCTVKAVTISTADADRYFAQAPVYDRRAGA
jgi:hypothetical protein